MNGAFHDVMVVAMDRQRWLTSGGAVADRLRRGA
jgi:hypothetical protein